MDEFVNNQLESEFGELDAAYHAKDNEIEKVKARFRDRVFDSSRKLLARFAEEADDVKRRDRLAGHEPGGH